MTKRLEAAARLRARGGRGRYEYPHLKLGFAATRARRQGWYTEDVCQARPAWLRARGGMQGVLTVDTLGGCVATRAGRHEVYAL